MVETKMNEQVSDPKVKKLKKSLVETLDKLVNESEISAASLVSDDGFVLANNSHQGEAEKQMSTSFASLSASILSMAEKGIEIINADIMLGQIEIDTGTQGEEVDPIRIILRRVLPNVLLLIMAPKSVNRGLIHYETTNTVEELKEIIHEGRINDLFQNIGSLTQ